MPSLSRRGFLAAGGAGLAGAVLGACGTEEEEPSAERDIELLGTAVAAEKSLSRTYRFAADAVGGSAAPAVRGFEAASKLRLAELAGLLEDRGGSADEVAPNPPSGAETAVDGAARDLDAAIAAYRESAALLSDPEHRRTAYAHVAVSAAEQAILHTILEQPEAPRPFVTGTTPKPHVFPDAVGEEDE